MLELCFIGLVFLPARVVVGQYGFPLHLDICGRSTERSVRIGPYGLAYT